MLKTAWLMDTVGNKGAHTEIQAIKIATPETVQWILDKAIQVHGAGGLSQDFPLAASFAGIRTLRFADGPDEVHKNALAKAEIRRWTERTGDRRRARTCATGWPGCSPSTTRPRPTGSTSCARGTTPGWPGCTSRRASAGSDLPREQQQVVDAELERAGAPSNEPGRIAIGLGMAAPTILAFGTEEQQALLRPLWTGEEVWCQLFSEPGAGSDLAAVATRAVRDGDTWVVNGQKVWTSVAHKADWAILVARTDPDVPKHAGLTYFLWTCTTPGSRSGRCGRSPARPSSTRSS